MFLIPSLVLSAASMAASPSPLSNLVIAPCEAGEHNQFETVVCPIELKNTGDKPIRISKGEARLTWDHIAESVVVPAHGVAYLEAKVSLQDSFGYTLRRFRFATDEPGQAIRGSNVKAFVSTVLDQHAPTLDFGTVDLKGPLPSKSITLTSREVPEFRILEVLSKPEFLDVVIDPTGRTIKATVRPNAPWGLLERQKIKLRINAKQQSEAWITVSGDIHGDIVPTGNPFSMGLMRTGNKNEFLIQFTSRSGRNYSVGAVGLSDLEGKAELMPCLPARDGCKLVRVTVSDAQPLGRFVGALSVELPDYKRTLSVQLVGMLLTPEYPVHDFDEEVKKSQSETGNSVAVSPVAPKVDVTAAIRDTLKAESPPPPGTGPLLRWSVANQKPIYGYLIYRADEESGPFLRINEEIIRAESSDESNAGTYAWRDNAAVPGRTYWYYIGMVNNDGSKKELTGPQKVVAK